MSRQVIHKHVLNADLLNKVQTIELAPAGSLLRTGVQGDKLVFWESHPIDWEGLTEKMRAHTQVDFLVVFTGSEFEAEGFTWLGTEQLGSFVFHVLYRVRAKHG